MEVKDLVCIRSIKEGAGNDLLISLFTWGGRSRLFQFNMVFVCSFLLAFV